MVPKTFSAILLAVIAKSIGGSANYKLLHSFLVVKKKGELVGIRVTCPFSTVMRVIADYPRPVSHQVMELAQHCLPPGHYHNSDGLHFNLVAFNYVGLNSGPNILTRDERRSATEGSNVACFPKPDPQGDYVRPSALTPIDDKREAVVASVSSW